MNEAETLKKKGNDAYNRKDYAEAFKCWSKAAERGNAAAQNNLGDGSAFFNGGYGFGVGHIVVRGTDRAYAVRYIYDLCNAHKQSIAQKEAVNKGKK